MFLIRMTYRILSESANQNESKEKNYLVSDVKTSSGKEDEKTVIPLKKYAGEGNIGHNRKRNKRQ